MDIGNQATGNHADQADWARRARDAERAGRLSTVRDSVQVRSGGGAIASLVLPACRGLSAQAQGEPQGGQHAPRQNSRIRGRDVVPDCWVEALGGLGRASIFIVGSPGHAEPQPPCLCPLDPHEVIVVLHARRGRPADGRCGDASSAGQQQCIGAREEECHGDTQEGHRVPRGCGLRRETSSQVPIWCTSQGKGSGTYLI